MKKISLLAVSFVLFTSFSVPFLASAADFFSCPLGQVANADGSKCVPAARSGSGGINLGVVTPYTDGIINFINGILVPVLMAIAFIVFLWGVFKYFIYGADNETERATGKQFVLWGIIGFVIILSVWGLVTIVRDFFSLSFGGSAPKPPTF